MYKKYNKKSFRQPEKYKTEVFLLPFFVVGYIKTRGQEIATPDFRQVRNDTAVSNKLLTAVCRFAHPTPYRVAW
ncbi:MAG: hypothetical protein IKZ88_06970 [Neisseriaceae bacterium]|nr:hypothetical protein [Neisseriaceae bacterium]